MTSPSTASGVFEVAGLRVVDPASVPFGAQNLTVSAASTLAICASGTATAVYSYAISGSRRSTPAASTGRMLTARRRRSGLGLPTGREHLSLQRKCRAGHRSELPGCSLGVVFGRRPRHRGTATPTGALSSVTSVALRLEGITHVYIVGGPLAVSSAVVTQLQGTQAFNCGGTTGITNRPVR